MSRIPVSKNLVSEYLPNTSLASANLLQLIQFLNPLLFPHIYCVRPIFASADRTYSDNTKTITTLTKLRSPDTSRSGPLVLPWIWSSSMGRYRCLLNHRSLCQKQPHRAPQSPRNMSNHLLPSCRSQHLGHPNALRFSVAYAGELSCGRAIIGVLHIPPPWKCRRLIPFSPTCALERCTSRYTQRMAVAGGMCVHESTCVRRPSILL